MYCRRCFRTFSDDEGYSTTYDAKGTVLSRAHSICCDAEDVEEYEATGRLSTRVLSLATYLQFGPEYTFLRPETANLLHGKTATLTAASKAQDAVITGVKHFEHAVWFTGLQVLIKSADVQGHACSFETDQGAVEFRSLAMCGRWRATIEGANRAFIDVITEEASNESRMGINGIRATLEEALFLLGSSIIAWKEGKLALAPSEVRILGT